MGGVSYSFWSEERNLMRSVIEVRERAHSLRLMTRRMGAAKPALELVPSSDRRTPTARDGGRRTYQRLLERVLTRFFIGSKLARLDLAGPACASLRQRAGAALSLACRRVGTDRPCGALAQGLKVVFRKRCTLA
jgi:hypothetical protein